MSRPACLLCLCLAACSSTTATPDARPADRAASDERGADRSSLDRSVERARDRSPGEPRPPAHWKTIAGANLSLEGHTITLLQNGEVLIAGGCKDTGGSPSYLRKSYRYLPASDTLVDAGELVAPRCEHAAVRLADGRVLVFAGQRESSGYLLDTELFDPAQPAASAWSAGPPLPSARTGASALLLADGQLLVTGGDSNGSDALDAILVLAPGASSWKIPLAPLKEKRRHHVSTLLPGGKVLLSGGSRGPIGNRVFLKNLETYDPKSGTSALLAAPMSRPRSFHSATLLDDGRVLIVGGYCEGCTESLDDLYDPKTDTLAPLAHPGSYPWSHVAAKLLDGRVLITAHDKTSGMVVAFNASSTPPGWDVLPALPHPRERADGVTLGDGSVLIVGGVAQTYPAVVYASSVERFFP